MPNFTVQVTKSNLEKYKKELSDMRAAATKEETAFLPKFAQARVAKEQTSDKYLTDLVKSPATGQIYVVIEEATIVGFIELATDRKAESLIIKQMFIKPDFRNKGLRGWVLDTLIERVKTTKNLKHLEVVALTQDRTTYKLLKKYDFNSHTHLMYLDIGR